MTDGFETGVTTRGAIYGRFRGAEWGKTGSSYRTEGSKQGK